MLYQSSRGVRMFILITKKSIAANTNQMPYSIDWATLVTAHNVKHFRDWTLDGESECGLNMRCRVSLQMST